MARSQGVVGVPAALLQNKVTAANSAPRLVDISTGNGVTVTADATSHTKGSWVELIASTTADCDYLCIGFTGVGSTAVNTSMLIDIGVGAAASETVIVANLPAGYASGPTTNSTAAIRALLPVRVPKGSRIAVRSQALVSADTALVQLSTWSAPASVTRGPTVLDTYGADVATSNTTTSLAATDTYYEVTAATTQAYQALVLVPGAYGGGAIATIANAVITLGLGGAGAEVAAGTTVINTFAQEWIYSSAHVPFQPPAVVGHIPKGTRIAVKSSTGEDDLGAIVIGVPYS